MIIGCPDMIISIFPMLVFIFPLILIIIPFWKIFSKAGFPGALSLLLIIPVVNILVIFIFAFSNWPALEKSKNINNNSTNG